MTHLIVLFRTKLHRHTIGARLIRKIAIFGLCGALVLGQSAQAGTLWVTPDAVRSTGYPMFQFEVPEEMGSFVSAKVLLASSYAATVSYEAYLTGDPLKVDGRATLRENGVLELDVSALMLKLTAGQPASVVFDTSDAVPQVLALRFEYRLPNEAAEFATPSSAPTLDDLHLRVGGDVHVQGNLVVDGETNATCGLSECIAGSANLSCGNSTIAVSCVAPKLVFLTSGRWNGSLGGISGGDAKCQAEADAAGYPGTYKAWLSDGLLQDPAANFNQSPGPYIRAADGTVIANNWADLVDGTLQNPIEPNPPLNEGSVWTGTLSTGQSDVSDRACSAWFSSALATLGRSGDSRRPDSFWTIITSIPCNQPNHLYCFQQ